MRLRPRSAAAFSSLRQGVGRVKQSAATPNSFQLGETGRMGVLHQESVLPADQLFLIVSGMTQVARAHQRRNTGCLAPLALQFPRVSLPFLPSSWRRPHWSNAMKDAI